LIFFLFHILLYVCCLSDSILIHRTLRLFILFLLFVLASSPIPHPHSHPQNIVERHNVLPFAPLNPTYSLCSVQLLLSFTPQHLNMYRLYYKLLLCPCLLTYPHEDGWYMHPTHSFLLFLVMIIYKVHYTAASSYTAFCKTSYSRFFSPFYLTTYFVYSQLIAATTSSAELYDVLFTKCQIIYDMIHDLLHPT
jgi:hypothetical protein